MARYRTPDLYFEKQTTAQRLRPLEKVDISTTAFLGFCVRGPVSRPVRVTSWKGFEAIFGGFSPAAALPQAVFSFFANGGAEAVVIRVARQEGEGAARAASRELPDHYGRPALRVEALDPGAWGNRVQVRLTGASRPPRTKLLAPLQPGATEARVELTRGFEPGAVLRLAEGARQEYVRLTAVERQLLRWDPSEALRAGYAGGEARVEGVELQLVVSSPLGFEIHDNLAFTPGHPRDLVASVNERSGLVRVQRLDSRAAPPYDLPQAQVDTALSGGLDGVAPVTPADFIGQDLGLGQRTALAALEDLEDVGLVCAPDLDTALTQGAFQGHRDVEVVQRALLDFCERRRTLVALLDVPRGFSPDQALDWRARFDSKFGALYYPGLLVQDPLAAGGRPRAVPSSGHVAGLIAKLDHSEGVHRAAANVPLRDALGLDRELSRDELDALAPEGINCARAYRGRGIRPWGARTLSSEPDWQHLNVRRLFIMIERTIAEGTEWAVFEGNNYDTWKAIERQVSTFLYGLWREGMLMGQVPEEGFFVRCDETLNPPETREVGQVLCEIGVAPVRPAEFIVFRIGQQAKDIITEEAGG